MPVDALRTGHITQHTRKYIIRYSIHQCCVWRNKRNLLGG